MYLPASSMEKRTRYTEREREREREGEQRPRPRPLLRSLDAREKRGGGEKKKKERGREIETTKGSSILPLFLDDLIYSRSL